MMAADTLETLGIPRGEYVIKINNRKVLDGVLEAIGLGGDDNAGAAAGRAARHRQARPARARRASRFCSARAARTRAATSPRARGSRRAPSSACWPSRGRAGGDQRRSTIENLREVVGGSARGDEGVGELAEIAALRRRLRATSDRVVIDPSVVRGLEYYTGPVFEAELTFEVQDEDGRPVRFGSVGGGGRYDGLVGRFRAEPVPATGFSIGVSRLLAALQMVDRARSSRATRSRARSWCWSWTRTRSPPTSAWSRRLRQAGIRAELYLGSSGMKAQMKYADKRSSPCVIIQGSNERERGEVEIKDLIEGAKAADAIGSNAEWKAARPAQFSVPEHKLVEAVREVLARHFDLIANDCPRAAPRRNRNPSSPVVLQA